MGMQQHIYDIYNIYDIYDVRWVVVDLCNFHQMMKPEMKYAMLDDSKNCIEKTIRIGNMLVT